MKKSLTELLYIVVGSFLFALSINLFVLPSNLGEGGVTGTTVILYYIFHWSPGITSFILNGILILVGYKFLDKTTTLYTIVATIFISVFLELTKSWTVDSNELILNSLAGGVLTGVGIGIIFRAGGTSAGSAILAKLTNKYLNWNVSYSLLFFDAIVVFASWFIIGTEGLILTILMLYVATKVMNFIIEGMSSKRAVTVISNNYSEIAEKVNNEMDRGVTVLTGYGYYTKKKKDILFIIISKQEITQLRKIIKEVDSGAFITVQDVRDVFGEGFVTLSD
ncbi:YitT family protein [Caldibacillus thermolactis]|jgi:uncharacterized membrane-anchored protein YitT (DUF2179 family)|uniref:YitT family protein n=1 Tax=Pallidibacillus thermolactis TaxID=251051 RepID=A0ABT2WD89_9BACI|nr:YitT family protein [Pallidibacillus thermolactis]MCU9593644.1 YitT family protein [Pallidibacillus thermolactis]MCU9599907.1 YitT family protein [Pallidibacillus thermolactis subsp. kokeshiiformis]MED1673943.1 YitT family protein [Pallidibacillus thermolactis subsp. kokeshiiformis]